MISEKEFDKDAAMLASIVGGHLNYVDSITSDRSQPANKIDLNTFLAPLRGGPPPAPNPYDPVNRGYIPEQVVQSMAPDVAVNLVDASTVSSPMPQQATVSAGQIRQVVTQPLRVEEKELSELKEDIKSIKATLLKIDSTFTKIAGMMGKVFNFITEKEKLSSK